MALLLRYATRTASLFYRLTNVELDVATEDGDGELAVSVEQCACPAGHTGTSCEVGKWYMSYKRRLL